MIKKAAILGASGYTGAEMTRLVLNHPGLELKALSAQKRSGVPYHEVFANFANCDLPLLQLWSDIDWCEIDVIFACLPHQISQEIIAAIIDKVNVVIDLSADFRFKSAAIYEQTYGCAHKCPQWLSESVYGLSEVNRAALMDARLVACPGCYPSCVLLSLWPAIDAGLIELEGIVVDAKTGVTGAGRQLTEHLLFCETSDGAQAYGVGQHRHIPEIEQAIQLMSGQSVQLSFTPHLMPINRGMITTTYGRLKAGVSFTDLREAYESYYGGEAFVHVEPQGQVPQTRHVRGSNHCRIGLFPDHVAGRVIIIAVLDNLCKGAAGQALQNYNIVQGWDETLGLAFVPIFP